MSHLLSQPTVARGCVERDVPRAKNRGMASDSDALAVCLAELGKKGGTAKQGVKDEVVLHLGRLWARGEITTVGLVVCWQLDGSFAIPDAAISRQRSHFASGPFCFLTSPSLDPRIFLPFGRPIRR